ncbi:MAG: glycoside hydrolase family 3 C-terminal domain-containing protein [Prevotellaceae bacterium]|jgi:beta-glucosidase|nr:glycoside hydrolase family 3 C-terminal domain-containing protein [Prevotellaceae bacterium]
MRKQGYLVILLTLLVACTVPVDETERKINDLLSRMTIEEKIGQMFQISLDNTANEQTLQFIREGKTGSIINVVDPTVVNILQKAAVEDSRLGIPILFGRDVIHGFKTLAPIPLGQAASFDPQLIYDCARMSAVEARSAGVHWTFAPMLDIARDARWGRIAEGFGEDPYLVAHLGAASIRGFQSDGRLSDKYALAACAKHLAGYGAAEGGRDYNSANIPPLLWRNVYLIPFEQAVRAGVATVMTSFNDNDGVPSSGNEELVKTILRDEWRFDGFVVSDWNSMGEMIAHGVAEDMKEVAQRSLHAGVDMEMVSPAYFLYLPELVKEKKVSETAIDNAVRNILRIKFQMGLFEKPYADTSSPPAFYAEESLKLARRAAVESAILLKNDRRLLPLSENQTIAIIGPMADAPHDQLGTWCFDGDKTHTVTPVGALKDEYRHIRYVYEPALGYSRDGNTAHFDKARRAAAAADVAVVFVGEEAILSGEAHSLSNLNLIGAQSDLLKAVKSAGKPVALVVMAGRPLTIERDLPYADAVLYSFHPGTMGGPAIFDLLFGRKNPSGKLPVTFVREVGQIPLYYNHHNTGRPAPEKVTTLAEIPLEAGQTSLGNTSFYLDSGRDPLFPFGFGLSYSSFEYSNLTVPEQLPPDGAITITATIKNSSNVDGTEVAQLYVRDMVASVARPVRELKGFQRVWLKAGETKEISFELTSGDLAFFGRDLVRRVEPGAFTVWVGGDSNASLSGGFFIPEK